MGGDPCAGGGIRPPLDALQLHLGGLSSLTCYTSFDTLTGRFPETVAS